MCNCTLPDIVTIEFKYLKICLFASEIINLNYL